jgi:uncharacterized membrane protein (UPF0127 family)
VAACASTTGGASTTVGGTDVPGASTTVGGTDVPGASTTVGGTDIPSAEVTVGDDHLRVWVADDPDERGQGLRQVERLPDGIDGMLFVFPEPSIPSFVMLGALIPLDLWFFDEDGRMVGSAAMEPCAEEPCPRYSPPVEVVWALETPSAVRRYERGDVLTTSASG